MTHIHVPTRPDECFHPPRPPKIRWERRRARLRAARVWWQLARFRYTSWRLRRWLLRDALRLALGRRAS